MIVWGITAIFMCFVSLQVEGVKVISLPCDAGEQNARLFASLRAGIQSMNPGMNHPMVTPAPPRLIAYTRGYGDIQEWTCLLDEAI